MQGELWRPTGEVFVVGVVCLAGSCGPEADGDGDGLLRTAGRPAARAELWAEDRDGGLGTGVAEGGHGVPLGDFVAPPIGDHPLRGPGDAGPFRGQEADAGEGGLLTAVEGSADGAAGWVEDPSGPGGKRRGEEIGGERKRIAGAQTHAEDYPD